MIIGLTKLARQGLLALGAAALTGTFACSSEEQSPEVSTVPSGTTGMVAVYTATFDDGTSDTQYFLRNEGGDEARLWFERDPDLAPGTHIEVWGDAREDGIYVSRFEADGSLGRVSEALIDAPPYPPRTFAFVLVDIGGGVNLSSSEAQRRLFGTAAGANSVKQYYNEASYGTQDITGEVLGPLRYPMSSCDTRNLASTLKPQIGVYDHYLWYMGSRTSACSWSGLAETGRPDAPANDTWYNGSAGCVVLVQEPGHNFGMQHSSSMTCGSAIFADNPDTSCEHNEYGDRYDPMGGGCNHMNGWQKVYEGWLRSCNAVRVNQSGTFTLQPLEVPCDGIQVLQIPMPKVRPFSRSGGGGSGTTENIAFYYLELRTLRGFDQSIRVAPTVLVHVAEDFRARTERGRHTWILDMDPSSTRTIDGLGAGEGFADPAGGVRFDVVSLTPDGATINVQVPGSGAPTCLDDSVYDPAAPATCEGIVSPPPGAGGSPGAGGATSTGGAVGAGGATGAGGAGTPLPRVEAFTLIDTDTDGELFLVSEGQIIDLDLLPPRLTLRADTDPAVVGSVAFELNAVFVRNESIAPYSFSSDDGRGDFTPWTLDVGTHTFTATPYTGSNGSGARGEGLTMTITLARGVPVGAGGSPGTDAGIPPGGAGGDPGTGAGGSASGGVFAGTGGFGTGGFGTGGFGTGGFGTGGSGTGGGTAPPGTGTGGTGLPTGSGGSLLGGAPPTGFAGAAAEPGKGSSADDLSCTCRVPGGSSSTGSSLGYPAVALGIGAILARRSRRRADRARPA